MGDAGGRHMWLRGQWVLESDASIPVTTHAFLYGTAVFEGIRAYWNKQTERLNVWKLPEHCQRLVRNARLMGFGEVPDAAEQQRIILELLRKNAYTRDVYIRPVAYLPHTTVRVRPPNTKAAYLVFGFELGKYFDHEGLSVTVSSWVRPHASSLPPLAKVNGAYANSLLASMDAKASGYDEAIMLNSNGFVSEGPAENVFLVRDGQLITPAESEDILDGVTRQFILDLAADLGIGTQVRSVSRAELYTAQEMFFCGTGVEVEPIVKVDNRLVGGGAVGPVTTQLRDAYLNAVRGGDEAAKRFLTPVE